MNYDLQDSIKDKDLLLKELADIKFALDQSSIVAITDQDGIITYVNETFCKISKYSKNELIGKTHKVVNSGYHTKEFFKEMWNTIQRGEVWKGEIKNKAKDGSFYWVKSTIVPFLDNEGKPHQYISIRQDITKQKEIEEKNFYYVHHDALTGLRNRRCFNKDLSKWITETEQMALLFLDLNRFKFVNDTLGHSIGDQILRDVAKRLSDHLNGKSELYRFGGDEFIIVIKNRTPDEVRTLANEIIKQLEEPFFHEKEKLYLGASIGVSFFPDDGNDIESLVIKADMAMYKAKKGGGHFVQFYTSDIYEEMTKTIHLEAELRQALEEEQFKLHYQPQVDISSNKIIGVEALIRWEHPVLGNISPLEFIPIAEETGLIVPITEWVLRTACRQNQRWQESGISPFIIGVNISSSLVNKDLVPMVKRILKETKLKPNYLEIELTESIMQDPKITLPILKELKELGIRISIDDFGTGYSSLAYLRQLPIDRLKIDRSFIDEMKKDNGAIVQAIIDLGTRLCLNVIAEGIETNEQLDLLTQLNCKEGQGYYFSRPLSSNEIPTVLQGTSVDNNN
ncbi:MULTISPECIES: GGDEF domain-containing phosphodiesterase [Neobacillus]|uniref:EAL domain-containing protein n=1 Tax=Neobacillus sedimentimangrovi TaxID=2699460 RepID=A0ABS8QJQ4_9BACI|nr:GGDEF domain-containing phosphodiesterase [Neobacillus sedimentimangrovi]MCD4839486.1 EAL domain-containing protein [Neobacillus sedimentimangrovi]